MKKKIVQFTDLKSIEKQSSTNKAIQEKYYEKV